MIVQVGRKASDERLVGVVVAEEDAGKHDEGGFAGLTFELTRGRQAAQPAGERRVERRVSQHGASP